jgi:hypothetical protein
VCSLIFPLSLEKLETLGGRSPAGFGEPTECVVTWGERREKRLLPREVTKKMSQAMKIGNEGGEVGRIYMLQRRTGEEERVSPWKWTDR